MNILYIAYSCDPYKGSEDQIGWQVPVESSKNNKVYVITKEEQRSSIESYLSTHKLTNLEFYFIDIPQLYKNVFKGFMYSGRLNVWHKRVLPLAKKLCREEKIDIIHQITPVEFRAVGSYGKIENVKFVCGPLGGGEFLPKGLRYYAREHKLVEAIRKLMNYWCRCVLKTTGKLKLCDYIMFANQETKDFLKTKVRDELVTEIGMKMPENRECGDTHSKSHCAFLVAGRLVYRKGHEYLLDALSQIPKMLEYNCRIVGDGPEMKNLRCICNDDESLSKHVTFTGSIPYEQMEKEYQNADVLIMPSIRETTGSVLLEAMAHKLPIITINKFGGAMVLDDETGWLYNGNTQEEYIQNLVEVMKECIKNPPEVKRRGENAYKKSLDYTWTKKLEHYNQIYEKCRNG